MLIKLIDKNDKEVLMGKVLGVYNNHHDEDLSNYYYDIQILINGEIIHILYDIPIHLGSTTSTEERLRYIIESKSKKLSNDDWDKWFVFKFPGNIKVWQANMRIIE